jgi:hypothetical protein
MTSEGLKTHLGLIVCFCLVLLAAGIAVILGVSLMEERGKEQKSQEIQKSADKESQFEVAFSDWKAQREKVKKAEKVAEKLILEINTLTYEQAKVAISIAKKSDPDRKFKTEWEQLEQLAIQDIKAREDMEKATKVYNKEYEKLDKARNLVH